MVDLHHLLSHKISAALAFLQACLDSSAPSLDFIKICCFYFVLLCCCCFFLLFVSASLVFILQTVGFVFGVLCCPAVVCLCFVHSVCQWGVLLFLFLSFTSWAQLRATTGEQIHVETHAGDMVMPILLSMSTDLENKKTYPTEVDPNSEPLHKIEFSHLRHVFIIINFALVFLPLLHPLTFSCQTALTITLPSVFTEWSCKAWTPTSTLHTSPIPLPPPPPPPSPRPPISVFHLPGRGLARVSAKRESSRLLARQGLEWSLHPESRPGRFDLHSSMISVRFPFSFFLFHICSFLS